MKIVVLNGSPKGDLSITLQSVKFIQKKFPEHEFKIFNIAEEIKNIEKDDMLFQTIMNEINSSHGVLWAFPLYVFLIPYQYKKFIELVIDRGKKNIFEDKYTATISTSIHFYDHIAHNYLNAICDDLNMKYIGAFSAEMYDLLKSNERERLILFAKNLFYAIVNNLQQPKNYDPILYKDFTYIPVNSPEKISANGKNILILSDYHNTHHNLTNMLDRIKNSFCENIAHIYLDKLDIKNGCLGCIHCGLDNVCVYETNDDYTKFYNCKVRKADIIIFAGAIKDRYLSSLWKLFFDRSFFNTHIPTLIDKQIGFIISGPLKQLPDLKQIFQAYCEFQQTNLVDIITDECNTSEELDTLLDNFSKRVIYLANIQYRPPRTFLSVSAMKIFRDYIWGKLRFILQGDHKFYSENNFYDFPQKDLKSRFNNMFFISLTKIPYFKRIFIKKLKNEMVKPHKRIVEKA